VSKTFVLVILGIFFVGFIVSSIIRMVIHFREIKHLEAYNMAVKEKLDTMNRQMGQQVANVHETMDIIHNDYNRMIKTMRYDDYRKGGRLKAEMDNSLTITAQADPKNDLNDDVDSGTSFKNSTGQ